MASPALVTFDVDGTLIRARGENANRFHKDAFAYAFKEVYGLEADIDEIAHHGSTDQLVLLAVLAHRGVPEEQAEAGIARACDAMVRFAGVEALLKALQALGQDKVVSCLVTGNLEQIAWRKMRGLGIEALFSKPHFGGFGSEHRERAKLVAAAADKCARLHAQPGTRFHLGDTPNDIRAAEASGATPVGLLTGIFSEEDLRAASANPEELIVLTNLSDTTAVLKTLGLAA